MTTAFWRSIVTGAWRSARQALWLGLWLASWSARYGGGMAGAAAIATVETPRPSPLPAEAFFDPEAVQSIHLTISPENLRKIAAALPDRVFVPGTFRWRNEIVTNVGIRYKGDSSSHPKSPHKRSFLIKFSEFEKSQRFLGLRRVALDNGIQFGSLFSERLITDILRDLGVPASRCNFARVYLNDEYQGVHVNVERIDESFLANHFGETSGVLLKVQSGGPGADLRFLGTNPEAYNKTFDLEIGRAREAYPLLIQFIQDVNQPDSPGDEGDLARVLDVNAFLKTIAVLLFAGAFDQYTGWNPHNYYLFQNSTNRRWTYLPWDLDVGFADNAFGKVPVLDGWHAAWPAPVPGRPLLERVIAHPTLLVRYRQEATHILERYFQPDVLIPKLEGLHAQIRDDLQRDPFPHQRATNPTDRDYEDIIATMSAFIRSRYALARAQLNQPGTRPAPKPLAPGPRDGGPRPGPASADAPSELQVVRQAPGRVELRWKDNAKGEQGFIVQKCLAVDGAVFQNAMGLPGENLTEAVDRDVEPNVTYRYRVYAVKPTPGGPQGTGVSNPVTVTIRPP